ncbi:MAG: membrane protein insertion efficiency factor YidD [Clostridiales bacterium]|nr:MAG: membrane protein insertion efficiency factor YidD [Clostridiales bacterium]
MQNTQTVRSRMKTILLFLVRFYRNKISPHIGRRCKYYPTCSHYAMQALEKYGAFKGVYLTLWRLLRCNPFSKGGYDPLK